MRTLRLMDHCALAGRCRRFGGGETKRNSHLARLSALSAAGMLLLIGWASSPDAGAAQLGLQVSSSGTLMHDGRPYRGVGVNYYDAFLRTLRNPGDTSYRQGFKELTDANIPFVRLAACGFWASDYNLYLRDKAAYFRQLDGVVHAAEENNVGLIPSLFWTNYAVPDLVGEPRKQWGNPKSKTRQFMRNYTQEVVSRYANSPAIWGWEFGCEFQLVIDFPDPLQHLPVVAPRNGTPARRGPDDILTSDIFRDALLDFSQTVRSIDPGRILLTGNALPRPAAYHMYKERRYGRDTAQQFSSMLLLQNPGPFSPICIHASPGTISRYFADQPVSFEQLLRTCVSAGASQRKPVYLEEFGALPPAGQDRSAAAARQQMEEVLSAVKSSGVPLASVWVYDRTLQKGDPSSAILESNDGALLKLLGGFNRSWGL